MTRSSDVVRLDGDEYDRLMDQKEILRQECERAWKEVDVIARQRDEHARWRQDLADKLNEVERHRDALGVALNKISGPFRLLVAACNRLTAEAEEWECDGLGLFAQHGYWDEVHEALENAQEAILSNEGEECTDCHAKAGTICADDDCPGRRAKGA